jgi:hypothetical protein
MICIACSMVYVPRVLLTTHFVISTPKYNSLPCLFCKFGSQF